MVRSVLKKTEGRIGVLLSMERDVEAGLRQGEAKEFTLARAVFDQEDGGVRHHYRRGYRRDCAGIEESNGLMGILRDNSELTS